MSFAEMLIIGIILFVVFSFIMMTIGIFLGASWGAPFIPSGEKTVQKMIKIAQIQPEEMVFDLGCGDGRFVFAAAKAGAKKAIGVEISPLVYFFAVFRKMFSGTENSEIRLGNFFHQKDVCEADVIFTFLLPQIMSKIFREIWPMLNPGARIISNSFTPEGVLPDIIIPKEEGIGKVFVFVKK